VRRVHHAVCYTSPVRSDSPPLAGLVVVDLDGRAPGPAGPAPYRVGEHTRAVAAELLGYPDARIEELLAQGVLAAP